MKTKVKSLIELLEDFDPEQEVVFYDLSDFYDMIFLGVTERNDKVHITLKNVVKQEDEGPIQ